MLESELKVTFMYVLNDIFRRHDVDADFIEPKTFKRSKPDLIVLFGNRWAAFEFKRSAKAPRRPNQEYYIRKYDAMSHARFVCPENLEEIIDEMENLLINLNE